MNTKKTLIMAIIAAVAVLAYWIDVKRIDRQLATKARDIRVVTPAKNDITELTLREGAKTKQFVKQGDAWAITQPIQAPADQASIDGLLNGLDIAKRDDSFDPKAEGKKLEDYGLQNPAVKIEVKAAGQNYVQEVALGSKTTDGSYVYAQLAKDDKVFAVQESLLTQATKPVNDYRFKNVLPASLDSATSAALTYGGKTVKLAKRGEDWALLSPKAGAADSEKVREVLGNIGRITAVDFIDTKTLNLASMGLDKPQVVGEFSALVKDKPTSMTLLVGSAVPKKESELYAMNKGGHYAFTIAKDDLAKLQPNLDDLRSKRLFSYATLSDVGRVIFDMRGQKVDLSADTAGKWRYTGDASAKLDQSAVNQTVQQLINLRATKFLDTPTTPGVTGLENPFLRLTVAAKDGHSTQTVLTAHTAPDNSCIYAKVEGSDQLVGIASDEPKKFFVKRDQFLDKSMFNFDEALVKKVTIKDNGKAVTFTEQPSGAWLAKADGSAKEFQVEGTKLTALIYSVSSLNWSKRLDPKVPVDEAQIKTFKLDQPSREITLLDKDGKELARLGQAGEKENLTYVRRGASDCFAIDKAVYGAVASAVDSALQAAQEKK